MKDSFVGRESPKLSSYRDFPGDRDPISPARTDMTSPTSNSFVTYDIPSQSHPHAGPAEYYTKNTRDEYTTAGPPSLTWRLDPDESLSDWTLTVVSNDSINEVLSGDADHSQASENNEPHTMSPRSSALSPSSLHATQKYFVHRTQLAVGPRRCEYFSKLFRAKGRKPMKTGNTRIELRPSAARAFPKMLDFVYAPLGAPPNVTTDTAVALRHLATCFGIRELFDSVTAFIKQDLSPETAPTYLLEADVFQNEKLTTLSLSVCAEHFEAIKFSRMVTLTPELFERVVVSPEMQCSSEVLSARVAAYCRCRPGMVDSDMLKRLTDSKIMPRVAAEESIFFLRLLVEMQNDDDSISNASSALGRTYDLYRRCVEKSTDIVRMAIANNKRDSTNSRSPQVNRQQRQLIKEYNSLPSTMKVDLLEHALGGSPSPQDRAEVERARSEEEHTNRALEKAKEVEREMKQLCDMYETKLKSYESAMEAQEGELRAYARELSKFKRVPNDHRVAPLLSEYTYKERPEHDEYGESVFGQVPPSSLPQFGRQISDGWVIREERWTQDGHHDDRCWPMYFYHGDS